MFFILLSCFFYAALNSTLKYLWGAIPSFVLIFYRSVAETLILLPFILCNTSDIKRLLSGKRPFFINTVRGSLSFVGQFFWVTAIGFLPITECVALSFTTPLFVTLLAVVLLRENMFPTKWIALIIGFLGALVICSPTQAALDFNVIFVLLASVFWALSAIVVKTLVTSYRPITVVFFTAAVKVCLSFPAWVKAHHSITREQFFLLLGAGAMGVLAHLFAAAAYKKADLSFLMSFDFTRLVFTAFIAFVLFGERLSIKTSIGAILILSATSLMVYLRQHKR